MPGASSIGKPACQPSRDPGYVVLHRLNRTEYNNAVRDLGFSLRPADTFEADDSLEGFDNISAALNLSPQLLAQLETAAQSLAASAVGSGFIKCAPAAVGEEPCARQLLAPLARRAWRRPLTDAEVGELVALVKIATSAGDSFDKGIELALSKIFLSSHFLYRPELLPEPAAAAPQRISTTALASRLSFFLWSSIPDEALLAAAESGKLEEPQELAAQIERMLDHPKATALAHNLADQWLLGREVDDAVPDPMLFASFDESLRKSIQQETVLFLNELFRSNLPLIDLFDAGFTFLDERLARHYGIAGVSGKEFRKVQLAAAEQRGGVLMQAAIAVARATTKESSPERRGAWALGNLLCRAVAPPPDGAIALQQTIDASLSPRQRAAIRAARPDCGPCHAAIDPIGFALENYDAVGAWRTSYGSFPVDASGKLGENAFNTPRELSALLKREVTVPLCLSKVLFTYALGRVVTRADQCALETITAKAMAPGFRARDLVIALIQGDAFRFQGADPALASDLGPAP
jgi:hypothetical protein